MRRLFRLAALTLLAVPSAARAQNPPDSVVPLPDSLAPGVSVVALDSGSVVDTVYTVHPDSVFRPLPALTAGAPARPEAGVSVWDRDALLGLPALTLLELLTREPDLVGLRYGDYGAPEAVLGPGQAGGRIRVFVDGFEDVPLDGAVPDLARVGLNGVQEVRIERAGGDLAIHLTSLEPDDARPLSLVEAGTGDLNTNLFRGTFLHPRAFGGTLALSLERKDSEGRGGGEPGSRQAIWFRYALHRGDDLALSFDLRSSTNETQLDSIPPKISQSSWTVRARARLAPSLVAELYTGSTSLSGEADGLTSIDRTRGQHGARLSWDRSFGARARAAEVERAPVIDTAGASDTAVEVESAPEVDTAGVRMLPDTAEVPPVDTAQVRMLPDTAEVPPVDTAQVRMLPDTAQVPPVDTARVRMLPDTAEVPPVDTAQVSAPDTAQAAPPAGGELAAGLGDAEAGAPEGFGGRLWGRAEGRLFADPELPSRRLTLELGGEVDRVGGLAFDLGSDAWSDPVRTITASARGVRGWTAPLFGLSLFGEWSSGIRGARIAGPRVAIPVPDSLPPDSVAPPVPPDTMPRFHLSDRTATRIGARLSLGPLDLTGTYHKVDVDSVLPLEILGTRDDVAVAGDEVTGFEVSGRLAVPVLFDGLSLVGSLLQWESEGIYRPGRSYSGGLDFHNVYKAGNLEFWSSLVVEGRDSMLLPRLTPGAGEEATFVRVPFYQSWNLWLQVRVMTVQIFVRTENLTLRRGNQDFPERLLPQTRSVYGIRWTLWN